MKNSTTTYCTILIAMLFMLFTNRVNAQDADKTVTLVVTGQGKTPDEAKQSALRSAIEQAFGAFISSKTEILNDNLVKDEIVSVSNGNIQKFEVLSEVELPESVYSSTLKATVSVTKLTRFCEHKGIDIEFKGSLFAANIKTQELYENNELSIVKNISKVASDIYSRAFDFKLEVSEPVKGSENKYEIKMFVDVFVNDNYKKASEYIVKCLTAISLGEKDVEQYTKLKKPILNLYVLDISGKTLRFYLRNVNSMPYLKNLLVDVNNSIYKFDISPSDLVISTTKKSAQKGFSFIDQGSFRNDRNLWYLFTGKCNDDNKKFQTAFLIKNYHEYDLLIKYSYYTGMYDTERNKFLLCNFPYRQEATVRNELGTNNLDLIFSLYNPYKNNYITTHALIQEFTLDKITSISKFTITPKY
jgi:hypothetical protein